MSPEIQTIIIVMTAAANLCAVLIFFLKVGSIFMNWERRLTRIETNQVHLLRAAGLEVREVDRPPWWQLYKKGVAPHE